MHGDSRVYQTFSLCRGCGNHFVLDMQGLATIFYPVHGGGRGVAVVANIFSFASTGGANSF